MKKNQESFSIWEAECPHICRFCASATRSDIEDEIYCSKKRKYLSQDYTCKKFKYDIIKKEVRRTPIIKKVYNEDDFLID